MISLGTWLTTQTFLSKLLRPSRLMRTWHAGSGKLGVPRDYSDTAKEMAKQWERDGDHYKLTFDKAGTWSQEYSLVWDQLLGVSLFPARVRQTELAFYLQHLNRYGLPSDNRADYTQLDWELWTATLAENADQFNALMMPIAKWVNETPARVPLTDWYDTKDAKQMGFQARSVVGGIFIKALADDHLAKKWRDRAGY